MSLERKKGCTEPNNQKSINPFVTVKGNILVSACCGVEAVYRVSDKDGFDLWPFCPGCLENYPLKWLEVKEGFDNEIHQDEDGNFEFEGYDKKNFEIIPKCHSETFTEEDILTKCFYCKTSTDEIQGHKVGLLSFKLVGQTINKELNNLTIKACENCYFTNEGELEEITHKDNCKCQYCEVL